jgi:hypothetical protein
LQGQHQKSKQAKDDSDNWLCVYNFGMKGVFHVSQSEVNRFVIYSRHITCMSNAALSLAGVRKGNMKLHFSFGIGQSLLVVFEMQRSQVVGRQGLMW